MADLYARYARIISLDNLEIGIKILDTLIEYIQGPCAGNQETLANTTKILENLEDSMIIVNSLLVKYDED